PPVTDLRLVLDVPEATKFGLGQNYSLGKNTLAVQSSPRGVKVSIDEPVAGRQVKQWTMQFGAPYKHSLKVGEYGGAGGPGTPGCDSGPLLVVTRWLLDGGKRTEGLPGAEWDPGEFVVREIEFQGQKVVRLAIDFIKDSHYGLPPTSRDPQRCIIYGSLRFNSRFQPSVPGLDAGEMTSASGRIDPRPTLLSRPSLPIVGVLLGQQPVAVGC